MKSGWVMKKLGEVCETFNGIWKGSKPPFRNVGVIRSTNFTKECGFDSRDEKTVFIDVEEKKFLKRKLQCGDIVVERSGGGPNQPVGRVLYFNLKDGDYTISNFTSALRVKDNGELDSYYLYRALCALYFSGVTAKMQGNSINIINLHFDEYLNLDIPIPPLSEQKRIVAKIDAAFEKIDALKANAEKNLANAKELFQSALDEAMRPKKGWVEKRLGEVAAIRVGPFGSSLHKSDYVTDGVPLVNPCHMKDSRIAANIATKVSKEKAESLKDYRLKAGDIVFARRGEIGRLAFVSEKEDGFLCGTGSLFARFKERYEVRFLYFLFSSNSFVGRLEQLSTGTTMKSINSSALESMSFSAPTIVEQKRLASEMELLSSKLESLQQNYAQQIADCVEMRQAILREAFEKE